MGGGTGGLQEPSPRATDRHGSDTNFAPLILKNGSLLAIWRSWEATGSRCFLATATDWREPSTYVQHHDEVISTDLGTAGTEDPFVPAPVERGACPLCRQRPLSPDP